MARQVVKRQADGAEPGGASQPDKKKAKGRSGGAAAGKQPQLNRRKIRKIFQDLDPEGDPGRLQKSLDALSEAIFGAVNGQGTKTSLPPEQQPPAALSTAASSCAEDSTDAFFDGIDLNRLHQKLLGAVGSDAAGESVKKPVADQLVDAVVPVAETSSQPSGVSSETSLTSPYPGWVNSHGWNNSTSAPGQSLFSPLTKETYAPPFPVGERFPINMSAVQRASSAELYANPSTSSVVAATDFSLTRELFDTGDANASGGVCEGRSWMDLVLEASDDVNLSETMLPAPPGTIPQAPQYYPAGGDTPSNLDLQSYDSPTGGGGGGGRFTMMMSSVERGTSIAGHTGSVWGKCAGPYMAMRDAGDQMLRPGFTTEEAPPQFPVGSYHSNLALLARVERGTLVPGRPASVGKRV